MLLKSVPKSCFNLFTWTLFIFLFQVHEVKGQYTDIINSNSPGNTMGAYSVGTGIYQAEGRFYVDRVTVDSLSSESLLNNGLLSIRIGLIKENLEFVYDVMYTLDSSTSPVPGQKVGVDTGIYLNRIGVKYLVYDPEKRNNKPINVYSWNANNKFSWRNLIPAIAIYAGTNLAISSSPFMVNYPSISPRAMLILQNHITSKWVTTINIVYDHIGNKSLADTNFIASLSHNLKPKWSLFVEGQYYKQGNYNDQVLRTGVAYLLKRNIQFDLFGGLNFKEAPKKRFVGMGFSFRIDNHKIKR